MLRMILSLTLVAGAARGQPGEAQPLRRPGVRTGLRRMPWRGWAPEPGARASHQAAGLPDGGGPADAAADLQRRDVWRSQDGDASVRFRPHRRGTLGLGFLRGLAGAS